MENKPVFCYTCAASSSVDDGTVMWSRVFVCNKCIDSIIKIHLFINNVKWLCPHCKADVNVRCNHCDLSLMIDKINKVQRD